MKSEFDSIDGVDTNEKTTIISNDSIQSNDKKRLPYIPARYVLALMAFWGITNAYTLRANLSVALVAMVDGVDNGNSSSGGDNKTFFKDKGEFHWDEASQGHILGAFYYGYLVCQIPAGWMTRKTGGKWFLGLGVVCTGVLSLLTPLAARTGGIYLIIVVRVLQGLGEGVTFPVMHSMWSRWAPQWERSSLVAFSYSGIQMGSMAALGLSGFLSSSQFGWPSVFYTFGIITCIWFVLWVLLIHDTPASHPRISQEEREYIEESLEHKENIPTPWKALITSPAVWGLAASHLANTWQFYSLLATMPMYLKNVLDIDIKENGLLSGLPNVFSFLLQITSGLIADYVRKHGYLSTQHTRKVAVAISMLIPAFLLVLVGFISSDILIIICLITSLSFLGVGAGAGYNINHLDIAPRFAGVLMAFTNTIATIPGIIGPLTIGYLTNHNQTKQQWQIFFNITAAINVVATALFLLLGKGEELDWAKPQKYIASVSTLNDFE